MFNKITPFLLLAGLGLSCSDQKPRDQAVSQCREVVSFWAASHRDMQHRVEQQGDLLVVKITMTMQAALGELSGRSSCEYRSLGDGKFEPVKITLGNTTYRSHEDIHDLLLLNKDFEVIEHNH